MINKSESIKNLAAALNKAQSEMSGAVKDANNPFFKSKYADLGAVIRAVKEPFSNNGLSYSQFPVFKDGFVGVETVLLHESGEWLSGELVLPISKQDPQAAGSAITYARRYGLQSVAGIPSEDDDGNMATATSKFVVDDIAKQWIAAIKSGKEKLENIQDAKYREKIKRELER